MLVMISCWGGENIIIEPTGTYCQRILKDPLPHTFTPSKNRDNSRGLLHPDVRLTFPTLWANLWAWTTKPTHLDFGIPIHLGVLFKYSWYSSP